MNKYIILLIFITFNAHTLQILEGDRAKSDDIKIFQQIENQAKVGDIKAQFELANMYYNGLQVKKDYKLAFFWYKQVAKKGYASAQFNVANSYYKGIGVEKNIDKAIIWYEKAGNQGLVRATYNLAIAFDVDKKDYEKSFIWYEKSAKLGHGASQITLANMYATGRGTKKDIIKAKEWFLIAVKANVFGSKDHLAQFLENNKQYKEAIELYTQAANDGSFLAQYHLAKSYLEGKIVKQDKKQVIKWATKAAKQGYHEAQQLLGTIYNAKKDTKQAIFWYKKASENNNPKAQYSLGVFYLKGIEVKKDVYKSMSLFIKSAKQGYVNAQYSLALRYLQGVGINKNYYEAVKWLKRAAKQEHHNAQYSLAVRYKLGQGIEKNNEQRIFWLERSSKNGNKSAKYELAAITMLGENTSFKKSDALKTLKTFAQEKNNIGIKASNFLDKFYAKNNLKIAGKRVKNIDKQAQINKNISHTSTVKIKPKVVIANKDNIQQINIIKTTTAAIKKANIQQIKTTTATISTIKQDVKIEKIKIKYAQGNKLKLSYSTESMYRLAVMYLNGSFFEQDNNTAFSLMQETASLGFPPAQNDLALMYLHGIGTKINYEKAYNLALASKIGGYNPAVKTLELIKQRVGGIKRAK